MTGAPECDGRRRLLRGVLLFPFLGTARRLVEAPRATPSGQAASEHTMNTIAEGYVRLVLAVGQHDADYVDAYYGPADWRADAARDATPLPEIRARASVLLEALGPRATVSTRPGAPEPGMDHLRRAYLQHQLSALVARTEILEGRRLSFDEESRALYDAVAPTHAASYFEDVARRLDARLPGSGPIHERYAAFRRAFVIPEDRVDAVFRAAIGGARSRTLTHVELPPNESFKVEYVTDKPWSGYNWYKGGFESVIQVNLDLPVYVDRAVDLACHEGYPGHHVYNVLLERDLSRRRGWVEFMVYPLFSPQSLIAEGTANYGIDVAFPAADRLDFERDTVFPLAGLDPRRASEYYDVQGLMDQLSYAGNEAARGYLDGAMDRAAAEAWLVRYALSTPAQASQRVRFFDRYRSYVINYNLGRDLVRAHIEARGGRAERPDVRWREFVALLASPRLPSGLVARRP